MVGKTRRHGGGVAGSLRTVGGYGATWEFRFGNGGRSKGFQSVARVGRDRRPPEARCGRWNCVSRGGG
ncbi:hypothetical protein LIER_26694 [Lithospermum erythrorhizon]|uniref:Uncharacterized protein n=1 Tax=Lithospermum erythrorhizon TaxID=34254 RepID=A0AAV3RAU0_LITER